LSEQRVATGFPKFDVSGQTKPDAIGHCVHPLRGATSWTACLTTALLAHGPTRSAETHRALRLESSARQKHSSALAISVVRTAASKNRLFISSLNTRRKSSSVANRQWRVFLMRIDLNPFNLDVLYSFRANHSRLVISEFLVGCYPVLIPAQTQQLEEG